MTSSADSGLKTIFEPDPTHRPVHRDIKILEVLGEYLYKIKYMENILYCLFVAE